jgi:hypothetical protein
MEVVVSCVPVELLIAILPETSIDTEPPPLLMLAAGPPPEELMVMDEPDVETLMPDPALIEIPP